MTVNQKVEAALRQPDTRTMSFKMTDERRERFTRISAAVVDLLKANTEGPGEAYTLLQFIREAFERTYDIRGTFTVDKKDPS